MTSAGTAAPTDSTSPPRIEYLKVRNFRALQSVEFKKLTPMTVLVGPNGSGKSTVFDVFAFLADCFESGLQNAWDRRGRARQIKTRGSTGAVTIEIKYRESTKPKTPLITYHLSVNEVNRAPIVESEWLSWTWRNGGRPFRFLEYERGAGHAASGIEPDAAAQRVSRRLRSPDLLAVDALGQFQEHPRVAALRDFIRGWYLSDVTADKINSLREAGPQERLSRTGDNLANVIQYLNEQHPDRLRRILAALRLRVPRFESATADARADGRLLLRIKDAPFDDPILAVFASEGTLKMLAYYVLMHDPEPPPFIGMEEPENFLHPRLLAGLAEQCRSAAERTQLLVTTHSPLFINSIGPDEVRILWRDENGHTQTELLSNLRGVADFMAEGAQLGSLWMEGHFGVGDPLTAHGAPIHALD